MIENGCTDQLSDFKRRPLFFVGWCGCWSPQRQNSNHHCQWEHPSPGSFVCSYVIWRRKAESDARICIFFLCSHKNVFPDSTKSCGPYKPRRAETACNSSRHANRGSHDTIGRIHLPFNTRNHLGFIQVVVVDFFFLFTICILTFHFNEQTFIDIIDRTLKEQKPFYPPPSIRSAVNEVYTQRWIFMQRHSWVKRDTVSVLSPLQLSHYYIVFVLITNARTESGTTAAADRTLHRHTADVSRERLSF